MQIKTIDPDKVRYNPATSQFEALVTISSQAGITRYPCAVAGTIKTPPAGIIFKLVQQAKARHRRQTGLCARTAIPVRPGEHHQQTPAGASPLAA